MDKHALQLESERLERERRALVQRLYQLVDELESPPFRSRSVRRFPFNLLERAVSRFLTGLRRWVDHSVGIALAKLEREIG
jgi:hypothetical protein